MVTVIANIIGALSAAGTVEEMYLLDENNQILLDENGQGLLNE